MRTNPIGSARAQLVVVAGTPRDQFKLITDHRDFAGDSNRH